MGGRRPSLLIVFRSGHAAEVAVHEGFRPIDGQRQALFAKHCDDIFEAFVLNGLGAHA
ncbi:hypothetical protein [Terrihabitans sp. B22-R8]|uniref:hypothetical protein n=1 Tax=Terrihabitans sp. B22-R8 TaxID=3425128 RepID=UPI00403C1E20